MVYQSDLAHRISEEIESHGWSLYRAPPDKRINLVQTISHGPTRNLGPCAQYLILPKIKDKYDHVKVIAALRFIQECSREDPAPSISIDEERVHIRILRTRKRNVEIHGNDKMERLSYKGLLERIDSIQTFYPK